MKLYRVDKSIRILYSRQNHLKRNVHFILWTNLGHASLQVVLAHVGSLIADGLLCSLHGVAQVTAAALELLQNLQQDAELLLPTRERDFN